jgi:hypothetical protein
MSLMSGYSFLVFYAHAARILGSKFASVRYTVGARPLQDSR